MDGKKTPKKDGGKRKPERLTDEEILLRNRLERDKREADMPAERKYSAPSLADVRRAAAEADVQGDRPPEPRAKMTFSEWWRNVYWYHFKWHTFGGIALVIIVVSIIYSIATNYKTDMDVVVIVDFAVTETPFEPIKEAIAPAVGDVNGDGQVYVGLQALYIIEENEIESEMDMVMPQRLMLTFVEETTSLYLVDKAGLEYMLVNEAAVLLEDLGVADRYSEYGIREGVAVPVHGSGIVKEIGFSEEYPLYAVFRANNSKMNAPDFYPPAIRALDRILES